MSALLEVALIVGLTFAFRTVLSVRVLEQLERQTTRRQKIAVTITVVAIAAIILIQGIAQIYSH